LKVWKKIQDFQGPARALYTVTNDGQNIIKKRIQLLKLDSKTEVVNLETEL